jgi:hypothetical protein
MYVPRHITSRAALTDCYAPAGPNQSRPEKRTEERLVAPVMAPWNVTVHVWFLTFLVLDLGSCLRLSQLIGSTLALEYMRAGTPFSCRCGFPFNTNIQNMLHRWDQLPLFSISCLLDFS